MSHEPDRPERLDRASHTTTATGRVLIVDDHEVNRRLCGAYCDLLNFSCEFATSGAEAIAAVRESHFDLILMDIQMPGMSGLEATRVIRGMAGPAGRIPIIAVTSDADPQHREAYRAGGMADVVAKPFSVASLFRAITGALGLPCGERRSWTDEGRV